METRTLFRLLVVLGLASGLLASVLDQMIQDPILTGLKSDVREAIDALPAWRTVTVGFAGLIAIASYLVASIGLLLLRGWARPLYVLAHALVLFGYLLGVPVVYGNFAFTFNELSMLTGGMVIAMMYLEPMASILCRK